MSKNKSNDIVFTTNADHLIIEQPKLIEIKTDGKRLVIQIFPDALKQFDEITMLLGQSERLKIA